MTWIVLLPALAVIGALGALTLGLRNVEREVVALRLSLRRSGATAVAADELHRSTTRLRLDTVDLASGVRHRLRRPRSQGRFRSGHSDR